MGIVNRRVSYEDAKRSLKDLVLREMNRYLLPYWFGYINATEFQNYWDQNTRPYIFDVMTSSLYDLGFSEDGDISCRIIDNEHNCFWHADFYDGNEIGKNNFLTEGSLNIPYTGPFNDLSGMTVLEQEFSQSPWVEDDNVGTWIPPWIDSNGIYHPGEWTGYFKTDIARHVQASIYGDCHLLSGACKPSRVYRADPHGTYGTKLYHEFKLKCTNLNSQNFPPNMTYGLANGLKHASAIRTDSHIGIWMMPTNEQRLRLHCARDMYYPNGSNAYVGYGRKLRVRDPLSGGGWFDLIDFMNQDFTASRSALNEFKVTVERRNNDVIFIFWLARGSDGSGSSHRNMRWVSTPWEIRADTFGDFLDNWPGAKWEGNQVIVGPEVFPYPFSHVQGFNAPYIGGINYWYPVDIVHIRVDPTYTFDYLYVGNYWGSNDYPDFPVRRHWNYNIRELDFYETTNTDAISLNISGGDFKTDDMTLYVASFETIDDNIPLFLKVAYPINLATTIYMNGVLYPTDVGSITIYMYEREYVNDNIELFLSQKQTADNIPLYTYGIPNPQNDAETLFIYDLSSIEDLTTYTMVDESSQATDSWTYTRIDGKNWVNDGDIRWYYDHGAGFFGPTWTLDFEMEWNDGDDVNYVPVYVGNVVQDLLPFASCTDEVVAFYYDKADSTWTIEAFDEGQQSAVTSPSKGVHYWCKFGRRGTAAGTYEYFISLWENSARTGDPTITATISASTLSYYRYLVLSQIEDEVSTDTISFMIENFILSDVPGVGAISLFEKGKNVSTIGKTLFIEGWAETANTYTTLHTFGGTEGWSYSFDNIPLYINDGGVIGDNGEHNITLFLYNDEPFVPWGDNIDLYIYGSYEVHEEHMTMVVYSLESHDATTLFVKHEVPGGVDDYVPDQDQLPLYMHRIGESDSIGLVIYNNWTTVNSYAPLHIEGVLGVPNDNITLVLPDVISGRPNIYSYLFIEGHLTDTDQITLAMPNTYGVPNDNISLVCFHGGEEPNSYMTCYINGVLGVPTDNITLAIPEIVDPENDNVTLYSKGY
jgi:hypothetical protein